MRNSPAVLTAAALLCLLAGPAPARAESGAAAPDTGHAPFGLHWGMHADELREKAVYLLQQETMGDMVAYTTRNLPFNLDGVDSYTLLFDAELGLVRVQYLSKPITGDSDGRVGRERYRALKLSLLEKYGVPDVDEVAGLDDTLAREGFYACLQSDGCGWWHATYQVGGLLIRLQLHGAADNQGFVTLDYQAPDFQEALARWEWLQQRERERAL